jgi:hypothetical protein
MGRRTYNQKNQQPEERPTVKRRQFNPTEMRGVKAQLRKWCNARNQLALRITGQFFDLMFPGHLVRGPNDEGFVFQSSHDAIVSAIVLRAFTALELKQEDGRVIVLGQSVLGSPFGRFPLVGSTSMASPVIFERSGLGTSRTITDTHRFSASRAS